MKYLLKISFVALACLIVSCNTASHEPGKNTFSNMQAAVFSMMDSVSKDIAKGPDKWMHYFEDTSVFYMASDGKLVFPNYTAAQKFITDTLVHSIVKVDLDWQNINIDSIAENTVAINTSYHEDLTASDGNIIHADGYCTAIADLTNSGWKFRNLHWSASK